MTHMVQLSPIHVDPALIINEFDTPAVNVMLQINVVIDFSDFLQTNLFYIIMYNVGSREEKLYFLKLKSGLPHGLGCC